MRNDGGSGDGALQTGRTTRISRVARIRRAALAGPAVLIASATLMAGCGRGERATGQERVDPARAFAAWFVSPTPARLHTLTDLRLSFATWDSIAAAACIRSIERRRDAVMLTDTEGHAYAVGLETPAAIRPGARYPLVIYLHGGIGRATATKGEDAFTMLAALGDSLDLFLASPTATRDAPWWSAAGLDRMLQSLRYMTLHFPIDPDRVCLAGVSDGALGCYAAAECVAGPFAGFIPISGFGGMLPAAGIPLVAENLAASPFYAVYAGRDRLFAADDVRRFLAWMKDHDVEVEASFHPDEEHGFDYRATEYGAIAARLRRWSLDRGPDVSWRFVPDRPVRARNVITVLIPSRSDSLPELDAHFSGDTLRVRSRDIAGVTMHLDARAFPRGFRIRDDRGRVTEARRIDPSRDPEVYFELMQSTCFPRVEHEAAWSFTTR